MSKIKIANHHTGDFEFPMASGDILHGHITLHAGMSTEIDVSDWNKIKDNPIVKHWLEKDKISIVKSTGVVPTNNLELVDLMVPAELTRPEEEGQLKGVSAKIIQSKVETSMGVSQETEPKAASTAAKSGRGRKSKK